MVAYSVLEDDKFSYLLTKQSLFSRILKKIFELFCKTVFTLYTPVKVIGQDKIPKTSYIMICNHNSHMDVALLMTASGKGFNHFGMLAARDYWFDNKIKRFLTNIGMNLIPIDRRIRGNHSFSLNDTIALCRGFMALDNRSIIMFPEGTRGNPGEIKRFKKGAAAFSIKLDVPIVPLYVHGSHKAWPRGKFFMRPTFIKLEVGDPLYPKDFIEEHLGTEYDSGLDPQPVIQFTKDLENMIKNMGEKYHV
ncbi:MAG: 1-acyl-sn-glycerol-3-phosphate acyltransferase [Candidatus Marinimicrobia bacterium]|jgi:1-acyl-sn-glycerol-3-phosphate acyltransferase|nr:1-acyl-sn-glycerol-3-phosphate acyltransferase [Candidatus Neomarinimicrobiota bacterium]MBT3495931.1 1-acyl-sn-glycerol-3-phosphate acyltransferase [Candidatus Neomarinimicrobiota bacterium]MBT3692280.1 1-acyl-sn-glycerol-3-phosphate acyltransferase [Candidatus Neomarinimicrobiota bacterium]MBT3731804.1 1-acyl-sn-glycerol-3-phosphate acyltransferase [Candidatus Neomarinimicrobiota bacterium]MBT4177906.1 1-acyl-sn-glycerol-3-phosphate acyltransferase [Candidatus Neomarinimicrobiota bacterium